MSELVPVMGCEWAIPIDFESSNGERCVCANGNVLIWERKLRTNSRENLYFLLLFNIRGTARKKSGAKNTIHRNEFEEKNFYSNKIKSVRNERRKIFMFMIQTRVLSSFKFFCTVKKKHCENSEYDCVCNALTLSSHLKSARATQISWANSL